MKTPSKNLILRLILIAGLLIPRGLSAQTFLSGDWTQGSPAVTVGTDTNGTLVATAPLNSSFTFNSTESATTNPQLLWVPAWGAFRAGSFYNAPSSTTMGPYSVAFGSSTASGSRAAAFNGSMASGDNSFSCGGSTASGENAIALGDYAFASNYDTLAIGVFSDATGDSALAIGPATSASGNTSLALGNDSLATGDYAMALGGGGAQASGTYSVAIGCEVAASGTYSTAMGSSTSANSYNSFVLGQNNLGLTESSGTPSATAWVSTDPLFEIGNGTSWSAKSDALVVYKDGSAQFAGPVKVPQSGDIPMYTGN